MFSTLDNQRYQAGYYHVADQWLLQASSRCPYQATPKKTTRGLNRVRWRMLGNSYIVYQASVNVDQRGKLMRKIHVSDAGEGDQRHLSMLMLLAPINTKRDVYADSRYTMTKQVVKQGVRDGMQRRRHKQHPLTARQQQSNKYVAKTLARIEQVFAAMQQMGGKLVRCIGLKRADFAIKIKASVDHMRRLVCLPGSALDAF